MKKSSGLTFSISCAGEVESAARARPWLSSSGPGGGFGPPGGAAQMADWSTVIFVPLMRFSSCPSIRGSHWSKFLSNPAKAEVRRRLGRGGRRRGTALTQMALQEGQRRFVAEVDGDLGVDLSFQLHQLPDPVSCQEGEVGEALVHRPPGDGRKATSDPFRRRGTVVPAVPDGDHLALGDGRVQLPHATDVPRPLELLRVDEKERLLDPGKGLVLQREHPGVQRDAAPEQGEAPVMSQHRIGERIEAEALKTHT